MINLLFTIFAAYVVTLWIIRQMAKISKHKYLINRGILNEEATRDTITPKLIGFFHPYCNSGGGGERVLWTAVKSLLLNYPEAHILIYTGDLDADPESILSLVESRFGIVLPARIDFVYLRHRFLVDPRMYPNVTLLMQNMGSIILGLEAFALVVPDIFVDSMGYAFIYPLFRWLGGSKIVSYVHYPTISSDMLETVSTGTSNFNNNELYAKKPVFKQAKLAYYRIFSKIYGFVGRRSDIVMVNSKWTMNHINELWGISEKVKLVYPPCDVQELSQFSFPDREKLIVSVGQFRPEKNHELQLYAFKEYLDRYSSESQGVKLVIIGGCRDNYDRERANSLKKLALELKIEDKVEFRVNANLETLHDYLRKATIGLHSMKDEHFGIVLVEYMSAGCIAVAHNSGGPKEILSPAENGQPVGLLADTAASYAEAFKEIFSMDDSQKLKYQITARNEAINRFSAERFAEKFIDAMKPVMD